MAIDSLVMDLVRRQFGLISREQAMKAGFSSSAVDRRIAAGTWEVVARGVYRLPGAPRSWHQRALALCLSGQVALASHVTSGWLWNLDGISRQAPEPIDILVPHGHRFAALGATVRTTRQWDDRMCFRQQIPTTLLSRTLLDLAAVLSEERLEMALDSAFRIYGDKAKNALFRRMVPLVASSWPGLPTLRKLMSERDGTKDSQLEVVVQQLLWRTGLPKSQHNFAVFNGRGFVAKVDFAWPREKLILQTHGLSYHLSASRFRRDQAQQSELAALGWVVLTTTWSEVSQHANALVERLRRAFDLGLSRAARPGAVGPSGTAVHRKALTGAPAVGRGRTESISRLTPSTHKTSTHVPA
jgi:hypothetical protein